MAELYALNIERLRSEREPIIDKCELLKTEVEVTERGETKIEILETGPCERVDGKKCFATVSPKARWRLGPCNLATHTLTVEEQKKMLEAIKKAKRKK